MLEVINCSEFDDEKIGIIRSLAVEIWHEHYEVRHGKPKVEYMLEKFQSENAIKQQIRDGVLYHLLWYNEDYIGYTGVYPDKNRLFLSKIYIKSDYRGKGLGKQVLKFIENTAREKKLASIDLTVAKDNTDSIEVYKKLGFSIVDAIVKDIGGGFVMDDYMMKKNVDN